MRKITSALPIVLKQKRCLFYRWFSIQSLIQVLRIQIRWICVYMLQVPQLRLQLHQSLNQPTNQSTNQPVNKSTSQSVNQ